MLTINSIIPEIQRARTIHRYDLRPHKESPLLKEIDPKRKLIISIHGLGDVVSRHHANHLVAMQRRFPGIEYIGVETKGEEELKGQLAKLKSLGLEFKDILSPIELYGLIDNGSLVIDGVDVALPPQLHYEVPQTLLKDIKGFNGRVLIEKPVAIPKHLNGIKELGQEFPDRILTADFKLGSRAVEVLLAEKLIERIGPVTTIAGRFVENYPIEVLRNMVKERKGLLRFDVSGGGFLYDMDVHKLAEQLRYLYEINPSTEIEIVDFMLAYIDDQEIKSHRDWNAETYGQTHLRAGKIDIYGDAGKGIDTKEFSFPNCIIGEKGFLIISTGTPKRYPFIYISENGKEPEFYVFSDDMGYEKIFETFLLILYGIPSPEQKIWFNCTVNAASIIAAINKINTEGLKHGGEMQRYSIGETPNPEFANKIYISPDPGSYIKFD